MLLLLPYVSLLLFSEANTNGLCVENVAYRAARASIFGKNHPVEIVRALEKCAVVVAVIGNRWPEAPFDNGALRSDDPKDNVRVELVSALERGIPLIPLLIGTGRMPW